MANHYLDMVKFEPEIDCVDELVKPEQLNVVEFEDLKIKIESVYNKAVVKQEVLESIKHETLEDLEDEVVLDIVDGMAAAEYTCEMCEYETARADEYKQHILDHHSPSETRALFKCDICDFKTAYKRSLLRHNSIHSGGRKLHSCDFCDKAFKHTSGLHAHMYDCHKDKTGNLIAPSERFALFKCEICDFKSTHKSSLLRHNFIHSGGRKLYSCEFCQRAYKQKSTLHTHMHACHKEKTGNVIEAAAPSEMRALFKCEICDFKSIHKRSLQRHNFLHSEGGQLYPCEFCERKYKHKSNLEAHVYAWHKDKIKTRALFKCESCDFKTIHKHSLQRHNIFIHSGLGKLYQCEFCERAYNHKRNLQAHVNTCHKDKTGNLIQTAPSETLALFECETCDFKTIHKRSLRRHSFIHSERSFSCEFCEKAYTLKRNLHAHVSACHKDKTGKDISNKVHQCPNCPYKTIFRGNFKRHHIATHGQVSELEKLTLKCEMCGYETFNKDRLKKHMWKHSKVKKYACSVCSAGFNSKYRIDGHILARHKDNEELMSSITTTMYECNDCSYKTNDPRNIKKHINIHAL